jgi:hypothetical protein
MFKGLVPLVAALLLFSNILFSKCLEYSGMNAGVFFKRKSTFAEGGDIILPDSLSVRSRRKV